MPRKPPLCYAKRCWPYLRHLASTQHGSVSCQLIRHFLAFRNKMFEERRLLLLFLSAMRLDILDFQ